MDTANSGGRTLSISIILLVITALGALAKMTFWPNLTWLAVFAPAIILNVLLFLSILIHANVVRGVKTAISHKDFQEQIRTILRNSEMD